MKTELKFFYGQYRIEVDEVNMTWNVIFEHRRIGDFEFKQDEQGKVWVSNLSLNEEHRRKGIGSEIIRLAVKLYGAVFFYTGTRFQLNTYGESGDSRYLSTEGVALLESCLRKGIIKKEWAWNPYEDRGYNEEE